MRSRYRSDGTLDAAFGDEGEVTTPGTDRASGMLVDDRCHIIVAGYTDRTYNDFTVARYLGGRCESLFLPIIMR